MDAHPRRSSAPASVDRASSEPASSVIPDNLSPGGVGRMLPHLVRAMRPRQWTKNVVVLAALVFDLKLFHLGHIVTASAAFVAFCLAASGLYLINDIRDRDADRLHPIKRRRPIATGELPVPVAGGAAAVLLLAGAGVALLVRPPLLAVLGAYVVLMLLYSFWLKHEVIVDVFAISGGFVLRAAAGAVALAVPISPWLYVCAALLSLFVAFGKRRHELSLLDRDARGHRRNLDEYSLPLLDQFLVITTAATIMAYSLYTFVATNVPRNESMMLTIPFVVYAMFRYLYLVMRRERGGAPEQVLFSDRPLLAAIVLWGITAVAILYTS